MRKTHRSPVAQYAGPHEDSPFPGDGLLGDNQILAETSKTYKNTEGPHHGLYFRNKGAVPWVKKETTESSQILHEKN